MNINSDFSILIIAFTRNRTPKYREPGVLGGSSQSAPNLAQIPQVTSCLGLDAGVSVSATIYCNDEVNILGATLLVA